MLLDLLTVVVLGWVGTRLFQAARVALAPRQRSHVAEVVRGLRPRHFVLALPVLGAVIVAFSLLLQVPGLSFGWWTAIGGEGNPVVGVTSRTPSAAERIIPTVFLVLLVPALPLLVEREEQIFRQGSEHRTLGQRAVSCQVRFRPVSCEHEIRFPHCFIAARSYGNRPRAGPG